MDRRNIRDWNFWLMLLLGLIIASVAIANYIEQFKIFFMLGPFPFHHWLSWMGAGLIGVYTPIYYVLKRRNRLRYKTLLGIHTYGNIIAFGLISIHFTGQISLPLEVRPVLGTGVLMYTTVSGLVLTGFLQRFRLARELGRTWRFFHQSFAVSFYLIIVVHILRGLRVL